MTTLAYGYGRALRATHCDKNYGLESDNNTISTPEGIWDDLIANMINKSFGGAATGYGILDAKIPSLTDPTIFPTDGERPLHHISGLQGRVGGRTLVC
jgi:hypothetical protein